MKSVEPCFRMAVKPAIQDARLAALIAPCGMNCGLCYAFQGSRTRCPGCRIDGGKKCKTRVDCKIKVCTNRRAGEADFCTSCASFPCQRLQALDKRYRQKYGMSMLENLEKLKAVGIERFLQSERDKWACVGCGGTLCVHKAQCLVCKREWR